MRGAATPPVAFLHRRLSRPLPVAAEVHARTVCQRQPNHPPHLRAVVHPPGVLAPCAFLGIPGEIGAGDVVMVAERLTAMAVPETETNIKNKISRGGFTAVFFLQCLKAIGVSTLRIDE